MSDIVNAPLKRNQALPARVQVVLDELDRAVREYINAKEKHERARTEFETARERFASVKRLASEMMPWLKWTIWQEQHLDVRFSGVAIGDAILSALRSHAFEVAMQCKSNPGKDFVPEMTLDDIVQVLESGGLEFRSATPMREVNAALINLEGVTKKVNGYRVSNAEEILELAKRGRRRIGP